MSSCLHSPDSPKCKATNQQVSSSINELFIPFCFKVHCKCMSGYYGNQIDKDWIKCVCTKFPGVTYKMYQDGYVCAICMSKTSSYWAILNLLKDEAMKRKCCLSYITLPKADVLTYEEPWFSVDFLKHRDTKSLFCYKLKIEEETKMARLALDRLLSLKQPSEVYDGFDTWESMVHMAMKVRNQDQDQDSDQDSDQD